MRISTQEARGLGFISGPEPKKRKQRQYANKGKSFEDEIEKANAGYEQAGVANVQKISTPWTVIRKGQRIVSAFPKGKSTLDFRGTVKGGTSISFDCKESEDERGLPLSYIKEHQIEYIRKALKVDEISFILCYMKGINKRFLITGIVVIEYWDRWQQNLKKHGFNFIPVHAMVEVRSKDGIMLDYLSGVEEVDIGGQEKET